jgi:ABC-type transporter Mla subunit MlaD
VSLGVDAVSEMATRSEKFQLGLFMIVTGVLSVGLLMAFAGGGLMRGEDRYQTSFEDNVSGLSVGSQVRYKGVRVGVVRGLALSEDGDRVEVVLSVRQGTPLKEGVVAVLGSMGVTGASLISLEGGQGARLEPGARIASGDGFLKKMTGRADAISERAQGAVERLTSEQSLERIERTLERAEGLVVEVNALVKELNEATRVGRQLVQANEQEIAGVIKQSRATLEEVAGLAKETKLVMRAARGVIEGGQVQAMLGSAQSVLDALNKQLGAAKVDALVDALARALLAFEQISAALARAMGQSEEEVRASVSNLRLVSEELKQLSRSLREQPSRLIFDSPPAEREGLE